MANKYGRIGSRDIALWLDKAIERNQDTPEDGKMQSMAGVTTCFYNPSDIGFVVGPDSML